MRFAVRWTPLLLLAGLVYATVLKEKWTVTFTDAAPKAGFSAANVSGETAKKKYILEMNGSGLAFIDYNRDGLIDLFIVNGTRLEASSGVPGCRARQMGRCQLWRWNAGPSASLSRFWPWRPRS